MKTAVERASAEQRLALIKSHPDLADKTRRAAGLTGRILRRAEQRRARPAVGCRIRGIRARQQCLPREVRFSLYRLRPPPHQGFDPARFRTPAAERCCDRNVTSIAEIFRIAALRLDQLVLSDDRLPVHGRLSTHVLDTHSGRPAAGIEVELVERSALGASRVVTRAVTNADGRTDQPLIGGRPVPIGRYELNFSVGKYFKDRKVDGLRPAVPRRYRLAFRGERSGGPSACAAAGHALELCDLSRQLAHDPEKGVWFSLATNAKAFARRSCSIKELKRDADSSKSQRALKTRRYPSALCLRIFPSAPETAGPA